MMISFVVHGGYGKTATTFLQEEVFSSLESVLYLGKFHQDKMLTKEVGDRFSDVFMPHEIDGHSHAGNSSLVIPALGEVLLGLVKQTEKKTVLISHECIFDYGNNAKTELNRYLMMELLKYMRSRCDEKIELKMMMTIRNQKEILKSFYAFDYAHLEERFSTFDEFLQYGLNNKSRIVFGGYHYDLVLEAMQGLYGVDNVRFFLYEKMEEDIVAYVNSILFFIGASQNEVEFDLTRKVNANSSQGKHHISALKQNSFASTIMRVWCACRNNRFLCHMEHLKLYKVLKRSIRTEVPVCFSVDQLAAIDTLYSNSNERLAQLLGVDVEKYGYVVKKISKDNAG